MTEQTKARKVFTKIEGGSAVMLKALRGMIDFELEMRRTYPNFVRNRELEKKEKKQRRFS